MNMHRIFAFFTLIALLGNHSFAQKTRVEIKGNQFYINGKPTYPGRTWQGNKIEGLLMNARLVQGIFDDLNPETVAEFAYADTKKWDADRNTNEFVAAMPLWKSYGMNAFTLNMQGGSPYGYGNKKCLNPGFNPDGSLMEPYMKRLDRILKKADDLNMVVILGIFYFGQDQNLTDERAIVNATDNLTNWLFDKKYRNVIIEIANETNTTGNYDHKILWPDRIHELIERVKGKKKNGYRFLVGTSYGGRQVPTSNVVKVSDLILIHGNGAKQPQQIQTLIDATRQVEGYREMPVVNNEDDHFDFDKEINNLIVSVKNYVSWGYFDFRFKGETDYKEGFQSVPVDWGINSDRKRGFFQKVSEITGVKPEETLGQGTITVQNEANVVRNEAVVGVSWKALKARYPTLDSANFRLIDSRTKAEIPYQLERQGEASVQNLLMQVSVPAKSSVQVSVQKGKPAPVAAKTFARYVPERLDDFAWENDKVAFRAYGKALEGTKGDAYGLDVWVKRTDKLVLDARYKRGKYHEDIGDGMDYYHVGHTLGAGNVMPYVKDSVYYSKNYHRWKVLDNGPIRTTFVLEYDEWDVNGLKVTATKKITLDAGTQMNRVEATYRYSGPSKLPVVVGIIKRPEPGQMLLDEQRGIMAYWEPQHGPDGITGVGSVLLTPVTGMKITGEQLLAQSTSVQNEPFVYYTGACWNKAGVITDAPAWFAYLQAFKEALASPLVARVN
jgi:hypothetical protein